jgi:predicted CoA-binding protein
MNNKRTTVAVLGASPKPERYSNQAVRLLLEHGHRVIPIHPAIKEIEGLPVSASLSDVAEGIDTLTIYVSPALSTPLTDDILALRPRRVIFNPGTENPILNAVLTEAGINTEEACTLVLLNTGQF